MTVCHILSIVKGLDKYRLSTETTAPLQIWCGFSLILLKESAGCSSIIYLSENPFANNPFLFLFHLIYVYICEPIFSTPNYELIEQTGSSTLISKQNCFREEKTINSKSGSMRLATPLLKTCFGNHSIITNIVWLQAYTLQKS